MRIRCKFVVREASPKDGQGPHTARLEAVHAGSSENEHFFAATPSGHLGLSVLREQNFVVGEEYYLDLVRAEPTETVEQAAQRGFKGK